MSYTICASGAESAREAILDLWRHNFPAAAPDRYAWLYETGRASGFLLRAERGRAVGAAGFMRRNFRAFGDAVRAGLGIDLNVDRDHRTIGPALALERAVLAAMDCRGLDLIYAFPNRQSEAVLRRVGYRLLGDLQRWVKPLSCRPGLDRLGWPRWLARGTATLLDPIFPRAVPEVLLRRRRDTRFEEVDSFDARFDLLWESARSRFPILGERTSAYLSWRFGQCPHQRYRALCLTDPGDRLLAYLVYARRGRTVHIADLLFVEEKYFGPLLAELLRAIRREKAHLVVLLYLGGAAVPRVLRRFGFWQRPSGRRAMVYAKRRDRSLFKEPENWHLTGADIDTDE